MTNARVTIKDVYELVDSKIDTLEKRVMHRVEEIEEDVKTNTTFRNQLIGKMTVVFIAIGFVVNWLWDYFINNK